MSTECVFFSSSQCHNACVGFAEQFSWKQFCPGHVYCLFTICTLAPVEDANPTLNGLVIIYPPRFQPNRMPLKSSTCNWHCVIRLMFHVLLLHCAFAVHAKHIKQHVGKHWKHLTQRCIYIWATLIIVGTANLWLISKPHPLRKLHSSAESQDSCTWHTRIESCCSGVWWKGLPR